MDSIEIHSRISRAIEFAQTDSPSNELSVNLIKKSLMIFLKRLGNDEVWNKTAYPINLFADDYPPTEDSVIYCFAYYPNKLMIHFGAYPYEAFVSFFDSCPYDGIELNKFLIDSDLSCQSTVEIDKKSLEDWIGTDWPTCPIDHSEF